MPTRNVIGLQIYRKSWTEEMSGRPRTTSFAEGNKQPLNPPLGGMKISSKCASPLRLLQNYLRSQYGCEILLFR